MTGVQTCALPILHIVCAFAHGDVVHVENDVNPARDIETINTELILVDIQTIERVSD